MESIGCPLPKVALCQCQRQSEGLADGCCREHPHPLSRFDRSWWRRHQSSILSYILNYDLPRNPMRVEQRLGRVYRYGQDKVVQMYHFFNKGTIQDKVQSYFEDRLDRAAIALSQITGEAPEEIKGTLNGQLESEIDPSKIYKRVLVEGNLNKQTQQEIAEAVKRARQACGTTKVSLCGSGFSFENYRRDLASDLTLDDLKDFAEKLCRSTADSF